MRCIGRVREMESLNSNFTGFLLAFPPINVLLQIQETLGYPTPAYPTARFIQPPNPADYIIRILINTHHMARRTMQLVHKWYVRTYIHSTSTSYTLDSYMYVQFRQKEACRPFLRLKIAILDKLRTGQTRSSIVKEYGVGVCHRNIAQEQRRKTTIVCIHDGQYGGEQEGTQGDSRTCLIDASSGMKDKKKAQQLLYS